ncbi:MAG: hypothetical protein WAW96_08395, partial [Alphaproteobacteria bacterium]
TKTFVIPAAHAEGPALVYDQPASLTKRWGLSETAATFGVLKSAKDSGAKLGVSKLIVGEGESHVQIRFGSGVSLSGESLEAMISLARQALHDDLAKVAVDFGTIQFATGRDLEDFLKAHGIEAKPEEIEQ